MNAEVLKKAREICNKATEGPWEIVDYAGFAIYKNPVIKLGLSADEQICTFSEDDYYEEMEQPNNTYENAEFITFARTALPAALDEIERLQAENESLKQQILPIIKFISYNGKYPNLCSGILVIEIKNKKYELDNVLISGGSAYFANSYSESHVEEGEWNILQDSLPEEIKQYQQEIIKVVNNNVEHGCCGGCL